MDKRTMKTWNNYIKKVTIVFFYVYKFNDDKLSEDKYQSRDPCKIYAYN